MLVSYWLTWLRYWPEPGVSVTCVGLKIDNQDDIVNSYFMFLTGFVSPFNFDYCQ